MSFFGKFLLVLNLLGAAALGYFAIQDYGKRQSWSYSVLAYDFLIDGIPVDGTELDKQGFPLTDRLADPGMSEAEANKTPLVEHVFKGVGGNGVLTQAEEVKRAQSEVMGKLQPLEGKPRDHAFALAGVLLPFADLNLERDQYLAARDHLANDLKMAELRTRFKMAVIEGKALLKEKAGRTADEAFRLAFRTKTNGTPADALVAAVAAKLPKDLEGADGEKLFDAAAEAQRQQFKARLDNLFASAAKNPEQKSASLDMRKQAIARLLLGLALGKTGEEGKKARYRVYVVTGLKYGVGAVSERAAVLRQLTGLAESSAAGERGEFVADLTYIVEASRDLADRVMEEEAAVADTTKKRDEQIQILMKTLAIIKDVTKDRDDAVVKTAELIDTLKDISAKLLKDRVEARDLIAALLDRERQVRDLEKQVRELQKKKTP